MRVCQAEFLIPGSAVVCGCDQPAIGVLDEIWLCGGHYQRDVDVMMAEAQRLDDLEG